MEELEQKHLHLLQVVESEKTAKWQYTQHCEELTEEIKKLRNEVSGSGGKYTVRKESRETRLAIANTNYVRDVHCTTKHHMVQNREFKEHGAYSTS